MKLTSHSELGGRIIKGSALLVFTILLLAAPNSRADSYSAAIVCIGFVGCSPGLNPPAINDSPSPATLNTLVTLDVGAPTGGNAPPIGSITDQAIATASPGILGGLSRSTLNLTQFDPNSTGGVAQEGSSFRLDNIVLSGGIPGTIINVTLNVTFTGSFGASSNGSSMASSFSADAGGSFGSSLGGFGFSLGSINPNSATGIFAAPGGNFITPTFQARVGDTISVGLSLGTSAIAYEQFGGGPGIADGFVDFAATMGFSTSGPVFNLPDGVTANSPDGVIVNNTFVPVGTATTPELGTLCLLGSGLIALGRMVSRSKRGASFEIKRD